MAFSRQSWVNESSRLTTFQTPWSRHRWLRMPYGISPAPEYFRQKLDQNLQGLPDIYKITKQRRYRKIRDREPSRIPVSRVGLLRRQSAFNNLALQNFCCTSKTKSSIYMLDTLQPLSPQTTSTYNEAYDLTTVHNLNRGFAIGNPTHGSYNYTPSNNCLLIFLSLSSLLVLLPMMMCCFFLFVLACCCCCCCCCCLFLLCFWFWY